jgi:hypothetical protein
MVAARNLYLSFVLLTVNEGSLVRDVEIVYGAETVKENIFCMKHFLVIIRNVATAHKLNVTLEANLT